MALLKTMLWVTTILAVAVLVAYPADTWKDFVHFSKTGDLKVTAFEKAAKGFRR